MRLLSGICSLRRFRSFSEPPQKMSRPLPQIFPYTCGRVLLFDEPLYYLTVTTNFFVIPLHLTVMVALPLLIPFTTPLPVTVATFLLLLVYVTVDTGVALDLMVVVFPFAICCRGFCKCKGRVLNCQLVGCFQFSACCCDRYSSGFDSLYGTCLAVYCCDLCIAALICYRGYSGQCCFYSGCFFLCKQLQILCEFYRWSFYSYLAGCLKTCACCCSDCHCSGFDSFYNTCACVLL